MAQIQGIISAVPDTCSFLTIWPVFLLKSQYIWSFCEQQVLLLLQLYHQSGHHQVTVLQFLKKQVLSFSVLMRKLKPQHKN